MHPLPKKIAANLPHRIPEGRAPRGPGRGAARLLMLLLTALLSPGTVGCKSGTSAKGPTAPPTSLLLKQTPVVVEVAAHETARLTHLRDKRELADKTGLLLVFQSDEFFKLPTDDLKFRLDVLLLDAAGKVLAIKPMAGPDHGEFESPVAARYALMVQEGLPATAGIATGDTVAIPSTVALLAEPWRTPLQLGNATVQVEIVATDALRQRGLMYRTSLPPDAGMVFVFKKEQRLAFWMKDTRIPLDIVYLDRDGRIDSIKQMAPFVTDGTPSDGYALFAIELNLGKAKELGLKKGDMVKLPEAIWNPKDLE